MQEENKSLQTTEAKLSDLQEQVEALSKFKYKVEGKFDSTPPPSENGEGVDAGAVPMATNIPAPPPLPPVMDPDGTLIPPPPPIPFGKWVGLYTGFYIFSS